MTIILYPDEIMDEATEMTRASSGLANDRTLNGLLIPNLREWLYRQGARVEHVSDDELLKRVRHTFVNMPASQRP